jgi:hypothetical protein
MYGSVFKVTAIMRRVLIEFVKALSVKIRTTTEDKA